jgi:CII-binding regulator of phage lambda lysogenization HflD
MTSTSQGNHPGSCPEIMMPSLSVLGMINKLNELVEIYGNSTEDIQQGLDILKSIKEKEKE